MARVKFAVSGACQRTCSLNEVNLGEWAGDVHEMYEAGANRDAIRAFLLTKDIRVSTGAIGNHKGKHLEVVVARRGRGGKKTHLQILEQMIEEGGAQLDTSGVRISPEMTMRAIEMHHKLTEGSVWEDFLGAIGAMGDAVAKEGGPENPDAVKSEDEAKQVGSDVAAPME